jgi:hypothetical protein
MTLSSEQASQNLREIERTGRRSAQALSYSVASPYLIVWGVIWMAGYAGNDLLAHPLAGYVWPVLTLAGVAVCTLVGRSQGLARGKSGREGRIVGARHLATLLAVAAFMAATFAIMPPANPEAVGAFVPLIVALAYVLLGIWKGIRFLVAGIAIAALTLGGFFYLHQHFLLWMAAVGGGALVLAGLWLKKA